MTMNEFKITVEDKQYTICPLNEKDQALYEVHDGDAFFVIGVNEYAAWEGTLTLDESLVQKIGNAIEDHDA